MKFNRRTFLRSLLLSAAVTLPQGRNGVVKHAKIHDKANPLHDWSSPGPGETYNWKASQQTWAAANHLKKVTGRDVYIITTGQSGMGINDFG